MSSRKIALVVLAPLLAFALGWTLRALLAPPADEPDAEEVAQEAPAEGEAGAAAQKAGGNAKNGKGGKAKPGNAKPGDGKPAAGGAKPAAGAAGGAKIPNVPTAKLELLLVLGREGPAPAGTRVRLVPASGDEEMATNFLRWARLKGEAELEALFSEEGALLPETGKLVHAEVPAFALDAEVWSETEAFAPGSVELGKLTANRTKWMQIDVSSFGGAALASGAAAPNKKRDPAELVPFHGLVLTTDAEPAPVAGARVQDGGRTLATTDEEGRFELPYDAALAPTVRVVGDGLGPAIVQVGPGHATPEEALAVRLRPSAKMEVRLLSASGRPVPGVRLELSTDMAHVVGEESGFDAEEFGVPAELGLMTWTATTNNFGAAFLEGLPANAPIAIVATRPGVGADAPLPGVPAEVTLAPGEAWTDEWRLPERPSLRGRVVDHQSEPVPGAPIWLVASDEGPQIGPRYLARNDRPSATTPSAPDGSFVFEDVPPGVWLVGVGLPAVGEAPPWQLELDHLARPVEVPEPGGPELGEVLLRVGRGLTMHGVVLSPEGAAVAGALVTALESSGRGVAEARTDAKGEFTLGPLSKGSFRLVVAGSQAGGIQDYGPVAAGSRDLVLKLARATPLTGRVVSGSGDARAANVAVFQAGVLRAQVKTLEPEQPGVFEAGGLEPGLYDFVATTEDGQVGVARDVKVGPGEPAGAVRVQLAAGGLVTVRHDGPRAWAPFAFLQEGRPIALGILYRGVPRALFAPAGTLVVRLEGAGGAAALERTIEVRAGEPVELELGADGEN